MVRQRIISMNRTASAVFLLLVFFAVASLARAQSAPTTAPTLRPANEPINISEPPPAKSEEAEIDEADVVRVSTSLITVPAEVMDRNGRYVGNLKREDFRILENGVEQEL